MTPLPSAPQPAAPAIETRPQLEAVVENIVQLRLEWDELRRAQENDLAAVRQKYRAPLAELERYLTLETQWAETWARANPDALSDARALECAHATIGFRVTPPRVERASRRWTWSAIALKLAEASWGRRYLRVPEPEVDKDALLADRAKLAAPELRLAGIKIVEGERFFIAPHGGEEESAVAEPDWQEAA